MFVYHEFTHWQNTPSALSRLEKWRLHFCDCASPNATPWRSAWTECEWFTLHRFDVALNRCTENWSNCFSFCGFSYKDKENKRRITEEYIQERRQYRETGFDIHMVRKLKEAGMWDAYSQELRKIHRGDDDVDTSLSQWKKPETKASSWMCYWV